MTKVNAAGGKPTGVPCQIARRGSPAAAAATAAVRGGTAQLGTACGNRARGRSAHRVIEVVTIDLHRIVLNQDLARRGARLLRCW
jgi:sugar/nucleoside kinase (ribokinase family)